MARQVHAEGMRERQNMKDAARHRAQRCDTCENRTDELDETELDECPECGRCAECGVKEPDDEYPHGHAVGCSKADQPHPAENGKEWDWGTEEWVEADE